MQISSANAGSFSSSGLSAPLPTVRKPAVDSSVSTNAGVSSATNARSLQQVAPSVSVAPANTSLNAANNGDTSHALVLAHQRAGFDSLQANMQTVNRSGNETVAQRAIAEYHNVATQEQRFELTGVLAGVDVFA